MNDYDDFGGDQLLPDDELVSAVLDGEATETEASAVRDDPELTGRLREFERVSARIRLEVPPAPPGHLEAAVKRALDLTSPNAEGVADLRERRDRRERGRQLGSRRNRLLKGLSAAAVIALVALAGSALMRGVDLAGDDADDAATAPLEATGDLQESDGTPMAGGDTRAAGDDEPTAMTPELGLADTTVDLGTVDDLDELEAMLVERGFFRDEGAAESVADGAAPPAPSAAAEGCQTELELLAVMSGVAEVGDRQVFVYALVGEPGPEVVVVDAADCSVLAELPG